MRLNTSSVFFNVRSQATPGTNLPSEAPHTAKTTPVDHEPLLKAPQSPVHLIHDVPLKVGHNQYQMVVEIHAGERAKFETDHQTGQLFHELKKSKPRYVQYLGYPAAYGFFPQTLGFDGDPLDSFLLGDGPKQRGGLVNGHVIGAVNMVDDGEPDYKVLLAPAQGPFANVKDIFDLPEGVSDILQTWLQHYKRNDKVQINGLIGQQEAMNLLEEAHVRWKSAQSKQKPLELVA